MLNIKIAELFNGSQSMSRAFSTKESYLKSSSVDFCLGFSNILVGSALSLLLSSLSDYTSSIITCDNHAHHVQTQYLRGTVGQFQGFVQNSCFIDFVL